MSSSKRNINDAYTAVVFLVGLAAVAWVAWGFVGGGALSQGLALAITGVIAGVYLLGANELRQYRLATGSLAGALANMPQPVADLSVWLERVHPGLQNPVRRRIEGERTALPGPALTPYLVGLLVMLGMLGTFLGMVVTFKGAVFALEAAADLAAIRGALAEPIKGLSLSFGTSVAGVAASAMLGLMSAISRRERLETVRWLDAHMGGALRPFSSAFQREETFKALQIQAQALPQIAQGLQAMMDGVAQRTDQLSQQLREQQAQFHGEAGSAYKALADAVGVSLKDSLAASARMAGETIAPLVETAMRGISDAAAQTHRQLIDATQTQLQALSSSWAETAQQVSDNWGHTLDGQRQAQDAMHLALQRSLDGVVANFEQSAQSLLAAVEDSARQTHALQAEADQQRLAGWTQSMLTMSQSLAGQWRQAGEQTMSQQQAACAALQAAAGDISAQASAHVQETLQGVAALLSQSEELVRSRVASEAQWVTSQADRMAALSEVWRTELTAMREQEAERGDRAVSRLDDLQRAVAAHLATLGASLEAPMTRLLQTAAEVPQAAAGVISQLREEMSRLSEKDKLAVAERADMMAQMGVLLRSIHDGTLAQREAIDGLVHGAATVLTQAGQRFADVLDAQSSQVEHVSARVAASAVELSSLGEAFSHGVGLFSASNDKLMGSLQRIETALGQTLSRSDEQLAYYVAQAREVIDLSISAQQGIVEDLRRLHAGRPAAMAGAA